MVKRINFVAMFMAMLVTMIVAGCNKDDDGFVVEEGKTTITTTCQNGSCKITTTRLTTIPTDNPLSAGAMNVGKSAINPSTETGSIKHDGVERETAGEPEQRQKAAAESARAKSKEHRESHLNPPADHSTKIHEGAMLNDDNWKNKMIVVTDKDYGVVVDAEHLFIKNPTTKEISDIRPYLEKTGHYVDGGLVDVYITTDVVQPKKEIKASDLANMNVADLKEGTPITGVTESGVSYSIQNRNGQTYMVIPAGYNPNDPQFWMMNGKPFCKDCWKARK